MGKLLWHGIGFGIGSSARRSDLHPIHPDADGDRLILTARGQLFVIPAQQGRIVEATTNKRTRYREGRFFPDGKWLYFLSDRNFVSLVGSPWGSRQLEPFFDRQTRIYHVPLKRGERSPFKPDDELYAPPKESEKKDSSATPPAVAIDLDGIESWLIEVPVPPGNYSDLSTDGKRLYFVSTETSQERKRVLKTMAIDNKRGTAPETFLEDVSSYELALDNKKALLRNGSATSIRCSTATD
jgi:tricorn protease